MSTAEIDRVASLAERHTVDALGVRVCWRRFGRGGPPLVLLHGGYGNWMHWIRNVEALSAAHELWLPDMPGFGESEALPPEVPKAGQLAALVLHLTAALEALLGPDTRFGLAGFSFGSLVAMGVAERTRRVQRLALVGPAGHGSGRQRELNLVDWRKADDAAQTRNLLRRNLAELMIAPASDIDVLALDIHERACKAARFQSRHFSQSSHLPKALAAFDAPVLGIWGREDATGLAERVASALGLGTAARPWAMVERAGHWVQYQRPEVVNRLLLNWFAPLRCDQPDF